MSEEATRTATVPPRPAGGVVKPGETIATTTAPGAPPKGLRTAVVSVVTDKMDERVQKLSEQFKDFKFTHEKHDTRHRILVSGEKDLDAPTLERMRRTARSI